MKCIRKKIMNKLFFVKNNITVIVVFLFENYFVERHNFKT